MQHLIHQAALWGHDITPVKSMYGMWESSIALSSGQIHAFMAHTATEAVAQSFDALRKEYTSEACSASELIDA